MTRRYLPAAERAAIAARHGISPDAVPNKATVGAPSHGCGDYDPTPWREAIAAEANAAKARNRLYGARIYETAIAAVAPPERGTVDDPFYICG